MSEVILGITVNFEWINEMLLPTGSYLLKVHNRNTRTRCEICLKLTIKTPERRQSRRSGAFIVNFDHISHLVLVFLLFFEHVIARCAAAGIFEWLLLFRPHLHILLCKIFKRETIFQLSWLNSHHIEDQLDCW